MPKKLTLATLLVTSLAANANAGDIGGNITLTSDYLFRGISQTGGDPALQGDLNYTTESGFYFGSWASQVDGFADLEWDFYAGYDYALAEDTTLHLSGIYYTYHGTGGADIDYFEAIIGISQAVGENTIGASFEYAPDFGNSDARQTYIKAYGSMPLAENWALDAHVGRINFSDEVAAGLPDTTDWMIGISYGYEAFTVSAGYGDTSFSACGDDCNNNFVISAGYDF
jgi:uncharacterized protein (TIGR02001 family)